MVSLGMLAGRGRLLLRNVRLKGCGVDVGRRKVAFPYLQKAGRRVVCLDVNGGVVTYECSLRCSAEVYLYVIDGQDASMEMYVGTVAYT